MQRITPGARRETWFECGGLVRVVMAWSSCHGQWARQFDQSNGQYRLFQSIFRIDECPAARMTGAHRSAFLRYFQNFCRSLGRARRMSDQTQSFTHYDQNISIRSY
jgi:hypothetical protein